MSGPFMSVANRPRRRARRVLIRLIAGLVLVSLAAGGLGAIAVIERDRLPRDTTIGGVAVGGLSKEDARSRLAKAVARRQERPIRLVGPNGTGSTRGSELQARPELDRAIARAAEGGTVRRVLARLRLEDGPDFPLSYELGSVAAARLGNRLDRRFGDQPRDARVVVGPRAVGVVEARSGSAVDRGALRRALRTLPASVTLSVVSSRPVVSTAEANDAARRIERLLDGPRRVRYRETEATLTPARLRALVATERERGAPAVVLDLKGLGVSLRVRLGVHEVAPRDASFAVGATRVRVVSSKPGQELDVERIGRSLTKDLESTTHRAWFTRTLPGFTTEAAENLEIRELVSEFTTYYSCCQPRVTNIKRAAELLDGTILRPGERFSLNDALGRRTEAKGFVSAPQIFRGRLEDAVGGGISQIATTLFNAAFFAGLDLVAHQAHQFYISRYPMGREATVSWGGPELIFRNNWPAAILMKLIATDSGISVRLYSRKLGRRVETSTGEPYSQVAPRTISIRNSALPAGTVSTVQSAGASGFTVQYTRKVYRGPKLRDDERYTVRYDAQNAIVEIGPPRPKPKIKPEPPAEPAPPGEPSPPPAEPTE